MNINNFNEMFFQFLQGLGEGGPFCLDRRNKRSSNCISDLIAQKRQFDEDLRKLDRSTLSSVSLNFFSLSVLHPAFSNGTTVTSAWLNVLKPVLTIPNRDLQCGSGHAISTSVVIQSFACVSLCFAASRGRMAPTQHN